MSPSQVLSPSPISLLMLCMNKLKYFLSTLKYFSGPRFYTARTMVGLQLELWPSSVVVESGTGSGLLSHALARTLTPRGHLHTSDFRAERVQKARVKFAEHGLGAY